MKTFDMTNLDWALLYHSLGWSIVPVEVGKKMPSVPWVSFQKSRADKEQIIEWWTKDPTAGIGVITGRVSGIVVVDVDVSRGGDVEKVLSLSETGVVSVTGSGGFHCFYQYPIHKDKIPNSVGEDGIDIRGDGGFIVLPPSIHHSGTKYQWKSEDHKNLGVFPLEFTEKVVRRDPAGENWLSSILGGVGEGNRNQTCARLAGYFISKAIPPDVVCSMLKNWNIRNDPPLSDFEIDRTVQSVYNGHIRANANLNDMTESANEEIPYMGVIPLSDYMTKYGGEKVEWTVESWLPRSTIAFVIAPPGSYKTWLTLDLALSVATGSKFLGNFPVLERAPVLIYQQEDSHYGLAERLGVIIKSKFGLENEDDPESDEFLIDAPPMDIPIYFHTERQLRIDNKDAVYALRKQIESTKAKLVIIDPLYSAASMEDYMATAAQHLLELKAIRDELGVTFLIVHHTGKGKDEKNRERLWGSQFLNAALETGWQVAKSSDTGIVVHRHYKVKGMPDTIGLSFDVSTEPTEERYNVSMFVPQDDEISHKKSPNDKIIEILREAKEPMSAMKIAEVLGVHRTTASRRIDKLIANGEVQQLDNGSLTLF